MNFDDGKLVGISDDAKVIVFIPPPDSWVTRDCANRIEDEAKRRLAVVGLDIPVLVLTEDWDVRVITKGELTDGVSSS